MLEYTNNPAELCRDEVSVGTSTSCNVTVRDDEVGCKRGTLSKQHFRLVHTSNGAVLKNDSKQGIYVDNTLIQEHKQVVLSHNSPIAFPHEAQKVFLYADVAVSDSSSHIKEIKNKFVISCKLGHGGFGQVFLAIDKNTGEEFAVKQIQINTFTKREVQMLKNLKHPCIIQLHTAISDSFQNLTYIVLEYMSGGDLSKWINRRCLLNEAQIKLIFYQLALAIEYLHQNRIGHRDIKPQNILLRDKTPHTLIKITDFGLAKDDSRHSEMKTAAGSEPYVAPEVVLSQSHTKKVDIWSMGIILFYSITGYLPFGNIAEAKRNEYQVMFNPENWREVSGEVVKLVQSMLVKSPERRASISNVLYSPWLQDDNMRKEAQRLMTSQEPEPSETNNPYIQQNLNNGLDAIVPQHTENRRQLIPPRGVLQFMNSESKEKPPKKQTWRMCCIPR